MIFCLAKIAKLTHWEVKTEEDLKPVRYSVTLNPKTKLHDVQFALATTICQLKGFKKNFIFTVYDGNGKILYEYKH